MSDTVGRRAAVLFAEAAMQDLATRTLFRAALCGGDALARMLAALRALPAFARIDWEAVQLFALDDGWGPETLRELLALPLPRANLHRPRSAGIACQDAARAYEFTLRAQFGLAPGQLPRFDFVLLESGSLAARATGENELALWAVARSHGQPGIGLSSVVLQAARRLVLVGEGAGEDVRQVRCAGELHVLAPSTARSSGTSTPATARAARTGFASA